MNITRSILYAWLLGILQVRRCLTTRFKDQRQRMAYEAARAMAQRFESFRLS